MFLRVNWSLEEKILTILTVAPQLRISFQWLCAAVVCLWAEHSYFPNKVAAAQLKLENKKKTLEWSDYIVAQCGSGLGEAVKTFFF